MTSEGLPGIDGEAFLQDFLEESEEHLRNVSSYLLTLEQQAAQGEVNEQAINEILRAFHTIKGLSGMIGLQEAEKLSHELESVLRHIRAGRITLDPSVIDVLSQGTRALEAIINTVRDPSAPMPDIQPVLARLPRPVEAGDQPSPSPPASPGQPILDWLARALPPAVVQALDTEDVRRVERAAENGKHIQLAIFTPSREKMAAGVTVNAVREQLSQQAQVIKAVPLIEQVSVNGEEPSAIVRFAFLLASDQKLSQKEGLPELEWSDIKAASPPPITPPPPRPSHDRVSPTVRVDVTRLDRLMELMGDLIRSHHRLEMLWGANGKPRREEEILAGDVLLEMRRQLRRLREAVIHVRMVPLEEVFGRMPLVVRDLSRSSGKQVRLILEGGDTEVDKALADRLLDPLLHLVRNAIAHGIELPEERAAARKPPEATIRISGRPEGDRIIVSVADDGRGVDMDRVAEKARALGWLAQDEPLTPTMALEFLCRPGFSTRDSADMAAGRGVGMDVVWQMVSSVGGQLEMETEPGQGTTFILKLPLTLLIVAVILVQVGPERYAIPRLVVDEIIEISDNEVASVNGREIISLRGQPLPLVRLAETFKVNSQREEPPRYGIVVSSAEGRVALGVDRLLGLREVVVRHFRDPLLSIPGISGATELGDGRPILIVDVPDLLRYERARRSR
ncbi:MAG: chemotaxis protein CheA [Anaerolineae bacterium]|nr:chemotaxis protein CheA [Anaerolineae bacterium]